LEDPLNPNQERLEGRRKNLFPEWFKKEEFGKEEEFKPFLIGKLTTLNL